MPLPLIGFSFFVFLITSAVSLLLKAYNNNDFKNSYYAFKISAILGFITLIVLLFIGV